MTLAGTNQRTTMLEKNGVFQAKGSTSMQSLIRRGPQENVRVYNSSTSYHLELTKRPGKQDFRAVVTPPLVVTLLDEDMSTKPTTSTIKTKMTPLQRSTQIKPKPMILGKRLNSGLSVRNDLTIKQQNLPLMTSIEKVANPSVFIKKTNYKNSSFQLSLPTGSRESFTISRSSDSSTSNEKNHQQVPISDLKRHAVPAARVQVEPTVFVHVHDDFSDEIKEEPNEEAESSTHSNKRTQLTDKSNSEENRNRSSGKDLVQLVREQSEREKNELNEIVTNLTNRIKGLQDQTIKMKKELMSVRKENLKLKKEMKEFENQNLLLSKQLVNMTSKNKQAQLKITEKSKIIELKNKQLNIKFIESQNCKKRILRLGEKVKEAQMLADEILKF